MTEAEATKSAPQAEAGPSVAFYDGLEWARAEYVKTEAMEREPRLGDRVRLQPPGAPETFMFIVDEVRPAALANDADWDARGRKIETISLADWMIKQGQ